MKLDVQSVIHCSFKSPDAPLHRGRGRLSAEPELSSLFLSPLSPSLSLSLSLSLSIELKFILSSQGVTPVHSVIPLSGFCEGPEKIGRQDDQLRSNHFYL